VDRKVISPRHGREKFADNFESYGGHYGPGKPLRTLNYTPRLLLTPV
jgi:hypothetical protein